MAIRLHYTEQGTGFPLILLHGNGEDGSYFVHQTGPFAQHFRVIAVDTRGHGRSPRGDAPFTIRQFADDLLAFMDRHGIGKAHLLGFSDGGNIAMVFALAHPERVGKLILNGANLDASGVKRSVQVPIGIGYRIARLFAGKSPKARKNAEMLGLMVHDPDVKAGELSRIQNPTLVIAGEKDMIKAGHTRLIAESIPGAELSILPGDHFIASKNPQAFNEAVLRFLLDT
ncbi:MAG: alpha/beta fold hydrolase [Bacteroidales bacterium]|jgi:pimeloyl-ACP methyl ester carboxylesterase|nr:alpha/beta fold hydrolase [Bacteroidales bacterium]